MKLPKIILNIFIRFTKDFSSLQSYLKFFWLSTTFAILLPIIVGGLFIHYDNSLLNEYSVMLDYKTSHVNQNNDVIFVGDSSCLMGVSPKIIEEETGLKVLNLATYGGSGIIGYEAILRKYLKFNSPPKLIVYYISPSIPNMYTLKTFEQIFAYLKHPDAALFTNNAGEYNFLQIMSAFTTYLIDKITPPVSQENLKKLYQEHQEFKGFQNKNIASNGLSSDIKFKSRYTYGDYFNTAYDPRKKIKKLVSHFNNQETKVVVYLAPMAETEESFDYFCEVYKGITANAPYKLKNENFSDYTHLTYKGAITNSKIVAIFLKNFFNS
ncbi:MAG: hypothetical protein WCJ92_04295 [Alphaproteobacteria bacterium]